MAGLCNEDSTGIGPILPLLQQVHEFSDTLSGHATENPPPRPRYPMDYLLFEDEYPELTETQVKEAMQVMDEGYLAQDYYRTLKAKIKIKDESRPDTFDYETYSWTEHICRKWGQDLFPPNLQGQFERCGFYICKRDQEDE